MIEQFFRPDSVEQALELKRRRSRLVRRGSKLNATPTRTDKDCHFLAGSGAGLD